jgi:tripartite-type tricarboxylate transporter receptor subunit TctC
LLGAQVELLFPTLASSIAYIRTGKLRALGVTGATRSEALPDLSTVQEFVPGYEVTAWYGLAAPKGTPAEVIDKINREVTAGLADPRMQARFADLGDAPMPMAPAAFGKLIADETEKWGKVVKFGGIKPE